MLPITSPVHCLYMSAELTSQYKQCHHLRRQVPAGARDAREPALQQMSVPVQEISQRRPNSVARTFHFNLRCFVSNSVFQLQLLRFGQCMVCAQLPMVSVCRFRTSCNDGYLAAAPASPWDNYRSPGHNVNGSSDKEHLEPQR